MSQERTFNTVYHRDYYGVWSAYVTEIDGRAVKTGDSLIPNAPSKEIAKAGLRQFLKQMVGRDRVQEYREIEEVIGASPIVEK